MELCLAQRTCFTRVHLNKRIVMSFTRSTHSPLILPPRYFPSHQTCPSRGRTARPQSRWQRCRSGSSCHARSPASCSPSNREWGSRTFRFQIAVYPQRDCTCDRPSISRVADRHYASAETFPENEFELPVVCVCVTLLA